MKPISGLDIDALLGEERKGKVTAENPVPDFKSALDTSESVGEIEDAAKQMGTIIQNMITDSFGDSKYDQAMECFGVLREELINIEEPQLFNTFVKDLKGKLLTGALGGDRRDFWFRIRYAKIGLVSDQESESSEAKAEDVEQVGTISPLDKTIANIRVVLQIKVKDLEVTVKRRSPSCMCTACTSK